MELLFSLGVNSSLFVQFAIFLVVYVVLKNLLFEPYFRAFNERNERTVGQTEMAERYLSEARELEDKFAIRAKEVNERYKAVFDKSRSEALKEYDHLVNEARARAKQVIESSRKHIQTEMNAARTHLVAEVGGVSNLINRKLIGKDLVT
ncbi:MAG: ATP synthase F0 subunit B [Bdellovibrionales bacterium]